MNIDWNKLDKNLIVQIALELNLPDILSLCRTNKRFNIAVCESDNFWYRKIIKDYNFRPDDIKNAKKFYQIIKDYWNRWNHGMEEATRGGHKDLIDFFIQKGANNWDVGMYWAAKVGRKDLVEHFIQKGAHWLDFGMYGSAEAGHKDLVDFFVQKGAKGWDFAMKGAKRGGHKDMIDFFKQKIEEEYII